MHSKKKKTQTHCVFNAEYTRSLVELGFKTVMKLYGLRMCCLLSIENGFPIHTQKDFVQCEAMLNRNKILMT